MAISLVAHVATAGAAVSAPINTAGASLIVIGISGVNPVLTPVDSLGNTYTSLTHWLGNSSSSMSLYYVLNPVTGAAHTFNGGANAAPCTCAAAFRGVRVFDQQSGAADPSTQPGALTPPGAGALFVAAAGGSGTTTTASIGSGFTLLDSIGTVGGTNYMQALAYLIQPLAAALNPAWTVNGTVATAMATFLPLTNAKPSSSVVVGGGVY